MKLCKIIQPINHYTKKISSVYPRILIYRKYSPQLTHSAFVGETDKFNGITVDSIAEYCKLEEFPKKLQESLQKWHKEARRCVWFKINIKHTEYVPLLAQNGFNFHHARDDFVMMYKWLPGDSEPNLPPSSHTNLGVGAMVFNRNKQLLAISEKHYDYPHWKLPGGYVERGEDIIDAAVREVKEETGVDAEFQSLVTFRHTHNMMYGNSDIYILVMMKALSEMITLSQREVNICKWMDVDEYTNHSHVHKFNKLIVKRALEYKEKDLKLDICKLKVQWATYVRDMSFLTVGKYSDS